MSDTSIVKTEIQRPATFSFEEIKNSVGELDKFYKTLMQKGTDYDTIPGTPKPTLLKSGAELVRLRFGYNPQFKISKGNTDIEKGFIEYDVTCSLYEGNLIVAEGVGNANSLESKWRFRWVDERELPKGSSKENFTVKWIKNLKGGSYPKYRLDNENPQDLANTILKIAKKRAFVDAILTATGASRIFTQDVEDIDMPHDTEGEAPQENEMCPTHNVAWIHGKYGDYHYTDDKKPDGKKVVCTRKAVESVAGLTDAPQKEPEAVPEPSEGQKHPSLKEYQDCLNRAEDILQWSKKKTGKWKELLFDVCGVAKSDEVPVNRRKDVMKRVSEEVKKAG